MKAYEETVVTLTAPRLVFVAVVKSEWSAPGAGQFNTVKTVRSIHLIRRCVGPITGVHALKATKYPMLHPEIDFSVLRLVT